MAIEKRNGDEWGATIRFLYRGPATFIDAGVCAHLSENYLWAAKTGVIVPECASEEPLEVVVSGIWDNLGHPVGRNISAQVCIAPNGNLAALAGGGVQQTLKLDPSLQSHPVMDVEAILERTYADVYRTAGVSTFSNITATFS